MRLLLFSLLIPITYTQESLREIAESEESSEEATVSRARRILHDALETKRKRRNQPEPNEEEMTVWIVPPDPKDFEIEKLARKDDGRQPQTQATTLTEFSDKFQVGQRPKALAPTVASDAQISHGDAFQDFDQFTDSRGIMHRPRSRSPFTKPGLWEPNPDNPHNRDHANKYWYHPESVGVDWLNGQLQWGAHWAVPAVGTGGTDGMSTLHFPSIGNFFNMPDDYD